MMNARYKEVLKASTSKEVELSASDAEHDDRDNGSSSSSENLNFRGFTDEETKLDLVLLMNFKENMLSVYYC
ncbi:hypothetical protein Tco_1099257 [Tanacetum coccineum]